MKIIDKLKERGINFDTGLSQREFDEIEKMFDIKFPPDLKEFLSAGLPVSNNFINWRDKSSYNKIKESLDWPLEGIIFDIENNGFWYKAWGEKPLCIEDAIKKCKEEISKVPKLIPIFSHRYISSDPFEHGNPIISVCQTDIIYYGENLESYLEIEFKMKKHEEIDFKSIKKIRFWSEITS